MNVLFCPSQSPYINSFVYNLFLRKDFRNIYKLITAIQEAKWIFMIQSIDGEKLKYKKYIIQNVNVKLNIAYFIIKNLFQKLKLLYLCPSQFIKIYIIFYKRRIQQFYNTV